jgi:hypothetical protein
MAIGKLLATVFGILGEGKDEKTIMLMFFIIFLVVVSFVPVRAEWVPLPADLKIIKPEPGVPGAVFFFIF